MKSKLTFVCGIIAVILMAALVFTACKPDPEEHDHDWSDWMPFIYPNDILGGWEKRYCKTDVSHTEINRVTRSSDATVKAEGFTDAKRWTKEIDIPETARVDYAIKTIDGEDNVCEVTVSNGVNETRWKANVHYYYDPVANKSYEYKFEAKTVSGTRTLGIQCYHDFDDVESVMAGTVTITNQWKEYAVRGGTIPKGGVRSLQFLCADQTGVFYVRKISITEYNLEDLTLEERWGKSVDSTATVSLDYEVDTDGVCTITVEGEPMSDNERDGWNAWKATASYLFFAQANTGYTLKFEAWADEGERNLKILYYYDDAESIYRDTSVKITGTQKEYSLPVQILKKGGIREIRFQLAHQTGTVHVKIASIEPH